MEVVRKFIDASRLMSIISLPDTLKNRKLEIIVLPVEEHEESIKKDSQIESIVDSLTGIISDSGMELKDYRAERLEKYEGIG